MRHQDRKHPPRDRAESFTFGYVVAVFGAVAAMCFAFELGNIGLLGVSLGVDYRIAYLTGPIVDLLTTGLIVAASFLSHRGWNEKRLWPLHVLSALLGLVMLTLNCGLATARGRYGTALYDAVPPVLLLCLALVGPWLLRQLAEARHGSVEPKTTGAPARRHNPARNRASKGGTAPAGTNAGNPAVPPPTPANVPSNSPLPAADVGDADGRVIDMGSGPRMQTWVQVATPLYLRHQQEHGEPPTAAQLADALARAGHKRPGERNARNIRAATQAAIDGGDESGADPEPARPHMSTGRAVI